MCGICAYIGNKAASNVIMTGLKILQNRGYDSCGIVSCADENICITKHASANTCDAIDNLDKDLCEHGENNIGIGHTRWATHGAKTKINAHPHASSNDRIYIVHNGVIENYASVKEQLIANGSTFKSETDSEVIAELIASYLQEYELADAVKRALAELDGTWGLVVLDVKSPDRLIVARRGSPMLIGIGNNEMFIASEAVAFNNYTTRYISLNNDEIAIVTRDGNNLDVSRIERSEVEAILTSPQPYNHWTMKEIAEQAQTIQATLNNGGRIYDFDKVKLGGLDCNEKSLLEIQHLMLVACGTSNYASLYGSKLMRLISGFKTIQVIDASEFDKNYISCSNMGLLAVSQSGETKDVMRCLEIAANNQDIMQFSVVNRVGSQVARTTKCGVYLNAGRETAVASTKAFTAQVVVMALVAIWFGQHRNRGESQRRELIDNLLKLALSYSSTLRSTKQYCLQAAEYLKDQERCFILGKGFGEAIAKEGALKIKEITYLHAEGFPGGSLKHGPFALIEPGIAIIIILLDDDTRSYMETTIAEVKSRGAYVIAITDVDSTQHLAIDITIRIPSNGYLTGLIATLPLQIISYELSILKGLNPDKPRNLAKTVTVT